MAQAYKCDRCGKLYECFSFGEDKYKFQDKVIYASTGNGYNYDLCPTCKEDLAKFNIVFDVFSSEKKIRANGAVDKEIEYLKDHIYEDDGDGTGGAFAGLGEVV